MSGTARICGPDPTCVDQNVNRWHCMRGHDGAAPGQCPLDKCIKAGANRISGSGQEAEHG